MLLSGNLPKIGKLMNENHKLLQEIDVSSPELDKLVETALENGALGAKMTGAGRGGHMIALVEENTQEFGRALVDAGATRIFYTEIK
jgi:mevalonate kinase